MKTNNKVRLTREISRNKKVRIIKGNTADKNNTYLANFDTPQRNDIINILYHKRQNIHHFTSTSTK